MTDRWVGRLSEYIDGELSTAERGALERHLDSCASCRMAAGELRAVVARARAVRDRDPAHDLWPGIRGALGPRRSGAQRASAPWSVRAVTLPLTRLAAAAAIVALVSGALAWSLASRVIGRGSVDGVAAAGVRDDSPEAAAGPRVPGDSLAAGGVGASTFAVASYRVAAADLEAALATRRATLRPETLRILEENLRMIDLAIAQADSALRHDPGSAFLHQHLAATMQRKLKLLRTAVEITAAPS